MTTRGATSRGTARRGTTRGGTTRKGTTRRGGDKKGKTRRGMTRRGTTRRGMTRRGRQEGDENNLHKCQGAKYFTTLDSAGAYHDIDIHPKSREYTAIITPFGQYQFVRMLFGLCNAGAFYSRLMELALQQLPATSVLGYLDDIIVFSKSVQEHQVGCRRQGWAPVHERK
ncbi:MAG: RNA-directed DNA polymerase [Sphingomonadales bacterium]|nr:RNA-directed DNA polymerase [Sphingomonadales bacterium]